MRRSKALTVMIFSCLFLMGSVSLAQAQSDRSKKELLGYASSIARYCTGGGWETKACLNVMSPMNTVLAANYIASLKQRSKESVASKVEDGCAVAAKVNHVKMSASHIAEAYVLCINSLVDAESATSLRPDPDYYNLLLVAYFCTIGDQRCKAMENGLAQYK